MGQWYRSEMYPSNIERITQDYDLMWARSRADVVRGIIEPDPIPTDGSLRWGISAVFRLNGQVANTLQSVAQNITDFAGRQQVVYSKASLHTTVRSIESFRDYVAEDDEHIQTYVQYLQEIANKFSSFQVCYLGLTGNKTGVLAQGWPVGNTLQSLRNAFDDKLRQCQLLIGPEVQHVRQTAHASLIVFSHPLYAPKKLVEFVEKNRQTMYGVETVQIIEIVRYKKTLHEVEIVPLGKVFLRK